MKANRSKPQVIVEHKQQLIRVRLKNRSITLGKEQTPHGPIVRVAFATGMGFIEDSGVDIWVRGKSKFNVAVTNFAMAEQHLAHIFQLMGFYQTEFETPIVQQPARPKIIVP